jgi:hypothetical protein
MHKSRIILFAALTPLLWACGGSFPPPNERLSDAQSAERSAREVGAEQHPEAQLSLKLAQDQIAAAQTAMADGENEKADSLLIRAKADAELAIAQARARVASADNKEAVQDSADQKSSNVMQGAIK